MPQIRNVTSFLLHNTHSFNTSLEALDAFGTAHVTSQPEEEMYFLKIKTNQITSFLHSAVSFSRSSTSQEVPRF
jgi:hypothetical protein